jgi:hypothetical protein
VDFVSLRDFVMIRPLVHGQRDVLRVTLLYTVLTVALTWPLARGLTRNLPGDLGDPLFVTWVLAWDVTHLGRGLWNTNIFYPHPVTLAYSEHFLPQAIQILPVYALTRNPILCYNLVFLSTFVLSGIAMFLLVRELTGSRSAGILAGLAYAFAPYRFANLAHVQVLSSAWMPFVLLGLRRYFRTGRVRALAGAGAAWFIQNLSCGYYLFFFSPVVAAYVIWELTTRRLWTERRTLRQLIIMGAAVTVATIPFLLPYLQLRRLGMSSRSLAETIRFSADVHGYLTAAPELWIAGPLMQHWPASEGLLFPGFTVTALAAAAVVFSSRAGQRQALRPVERSAAWMLAVLGVVLAALVSGWTLRLPGLKVTSVARVGWIAIGLGTGLMALSHRFRTRAREWLGTPIAFFAMVTVFAVVMSFGPEIRARGRLVADTNLYAVFYTYVPGFDGLRAAARFAMIVALGLATLAGCASAHLASTRWRSTVWIAAALIVLEACSVPLSINYTSAAYQQAGLAALPESLDTEASRVLYRGVARLPDGAAIVELPLGEPAFDIRYMFYSTRHWKRLVNGYSGGQPIEYGLLDQSLRDVSTRPESAWQILRKSRATHAIVHESFYAGDGGTRMTEWLRRHGAREIESFGTDRIFALPSTAIDADVERQGQS